MGVLGGAAVRLYDVDKISWKNETTTLRIDSALVDNEFSMSLFHSATFT